VDGGGKGREKEKGGCGMCVWVWRRENVTKLINLPFKVNN